MVQRDALLSMRLPAVRIALLPTLMCGTPPRAGLARSAATAAAGVQSLLQRLDNSLKRELTGDSESVYPNQETREVIGAQWTEVGPQALPSPYLVAVSPAMAHSLMRAREYRESSMGSSARPRYLARRR